MKDVELLTLIEVVVGAIAVPWCAWVTASIYGLRTQNAILKEQCKVLERIEKHFGGPK